MNSSAWARVRLLRSRRRSHVRAAVENVLPDRGGKEECVLEDDRDLARGANAS